MGKNGWTIEGVPGCNDGKPYTLPLKLTGCEDGQFTCYDGQCIDILRRGAIRKLVASLFSLHIFVLFNVKHMHMEMKGNKNISVKQILHGTRNYLRLRFFKSIRRCQLQPVCIVHLKLRRWL